MLFQRSRTPPEWAYRLWKLGDVIIARRTIATDVFGAPPQPEHRRVVVTGMGLVTPLGVGVQRVWDRLLAGDTAVRALTAEDLPEAHRGAFDQLPSKVVACVPRDELEAVPWFVQQDARRTPPFVTLALTAAAEVGQLPHYFYNAENVFV